MLTLAGRAPPAILGVTYYKGAGHKFWGQVCLTQTHMYFGYGGDICLIYV